MMKKRTILTACLLYFGLSSVAYCGSTLTLQTWNMQWLTTKQDTPGPKRNHLDYAAMRSFFTQHTPDVLAFQEVDNINALRKVISNHYQVIFSDRAQSRFASQHYSDINQFTGFAVRRGIPFSDPQDIELKDVNSNSNHYSKLRFATYIVLYPNSKQPIHLLSVHLKAGCSYRVHAYKTSCKRLIQQADSINQWITEKERNHQAYIVMGDFNHALALKRDEIWEEIKQGTKSQLLTQKVTSRCYARKSARSTKIIQYRTLIDHVVASPLLQALHIEQKRYTKKDVQRYQLSDHCPIQVTFQLKQ